MKNYQELSKHWLYPTRDFEVFCFNTQDLASQIVEGDHMTHLATRQGNRPFGYTGTTQSLSHSFWLLSCLMTPIFLPFFYMLAACKGKKQETSVQEQGTILSSGGRWQSVSAQYKYFYFPLKGKVKSIKIESSSSQETSKPRIASPALTDTFLLLWKLLLEN